MQKLSAMNFLGAAALEAERGTLLEQIYSPRLLHGYRPMRSLKVRRGTAFDIITVLLAIFFEQMRMVLEVGSHDMCSNWIVDGLSLTSADPLSFKRSSNQS